MEHKLAVSECVAVGEVGLDKRVGDMELQEKVFKHQILLTQELKKPLVLHLQGKSPRTTSALFGRALVLTTAKLNKYHKVYFHSFSTGQTKFQLWHCSFPDFVVFSWLTTSMLSCEKMLRSMPATAIAIAPSGFKNWNREYPLPDIWAGCHHRRDLEPAHLNGDRVFESGLFVSSVPCELGPRDQFFCANDEWMGWTWKICTSYPQQDHLPRLQRNSQDCP